MSNETKGGILAQRETSLGGKRGYCLLRWRERDEAATPSLERSTSVSKKNGALESSSIGRPGGDSLFLSAGRRKLSRVGLRPVAGRGKRKIIL